MNPTIVFAKTDTGEDAVVQRTRLVQRNLRTVLILVDGKSTVEELVEKAGSIEMVTQALDQLERDGFIRRVGNGARAESAPAPAARKAEASIVLAPQPAPVAPEAKVEIGGAAASPFPSIAPSTDKPARPVAPSSPFAAAPPAHPQVNPFAAMPADVSVPPPAFSPAPPPAAAANPFQAPAANPFGASSPFGAPPSPQPAARPAVAEVPDEPSPVVEEAARPLRRRGPLLTPKRIAAAVAGLLLVLVVGVLFYPYGNYKPQIEAALSATLGQPVRVGAVGASFTPVPTLVLSGVGVGTDAQISVAEVRAVPSIFSLFSNRKTFSRIVLADARVPMEQLGQLASGLGAAGKAEGFAIGGVDFDRLTLGLRDLSLSGYSGHAEMNADGGLKRMALVSPDQALRLTVDTQGGGAQMLIEGQGWKPGEGSPYVFDSLSIAGQLAGSRLVVQKVEGRIFGGVIQGQFELDWGQGMAVGGDVSVDYMSAALLANALGSGAITVEGQANARIRFRAAGENWAALAGKVPLQGDVIMKSGAINGLDFVEAVRRGSKLAMRGGTTRFEQATGKFRWDGQALQLSDIDLSSGLVRATGSLGILRGEQLSGVLTVVLKGSAATVATPVSVVGTLKDPQLFGGRR